MHRRVVAIVNQTAPGLVLDIPAGAGPVREGLRTAGQRVVEVDLFPRPGMHGVQADACASLPFRSATFDTVVSMEGIEHFENQTAFLRECTRVLKPGGKLVLTTPNVLHLSARVSHFLTGQRLAKQGFVNEVTTLRGGSGDRLHHGHAFLIDAFRLRYLLHVLGLRLERLEPTNLSAGSLLWSPLLPLLWLATYYSLWNGRRHRRKRRQSVAGAAVERELAAVALSPALLFSRGLIAVAHKPRDAGAR